MLTFIILTSTHSRSPFSGNATHPHSNEANFPSAFLPAHQSPHWRRCTQWWCTSSWPIMRHWWFRLPTAERWVWESTIFSFLPVARTWAGSAPTWGLQLLNSRMRTSDFGVVVFIDTKVEDFVFEVCFGDWNRVDEVGVDKDLREERAVLCIVEFGL